MEIEEKVDRRKVKLNETVTNVCVIILTDASPERIREWASDFPVRLEGLAESSYVKLLYDSEEDLPENEDAIGYDESYSLEEGKTYESWDYGKKKILEAVSGTVSEYGMKVLGRDKDCVTVQNKGAGPDFKVTVSEA